MTRTGTCPPGNRVPRGIALSLACVGGCGTVHPDDGSLVVAQTAQGQWRRVWL